MAQSPSGETRWTARVSVGAQPGTSAVVRAPPPSLLPPAPSRIEVLNVTATTATLSWPPGPSDQHLSYTVEYWSPDVKPNLWYTAARQVQANTVTVK